MGFTSSRTGSSSRPPLERMLRIHRAIQAGEYPNASTLAARLEVSSKTIQRDLEFMRDRLDLPLEYADTRFGYRYTEEVGAFPTLQITEGELFALLVAEKALAQYRGTRFEQRLRSAFQKIAEGLPDAVSFSLTEWDQAISFRTTAEPILDLRTFDALAQAVSGRRQLRLAYRKPGSRRAETRVVDPCHLANINGEWFLFAYCHLRQDIRTFAPGRIESLEPTGVVFERPRGFSVARHLQNSFGVHSGQAVYAVAIHFDPIAADYIREKKWHASQQIKELKDGGLELRLTLSSLVEVQRWVLGWGGHAQVLEPPAFVASVREAALALVNTHPK